MEKLNIIGINGSASMNSSNLTLLKIIKKIGEDRFNMSIIDDISHLPHFQTELTNENVPEQIVEFRDRIKKADGIIISTPEYVFSIPSRLKNALEWLVSETIMTDKPTGLITAAANGKLGHAELKLILKTIQASYTDETCLLIQAIKGKINETGKIIDEATNENLEKFVNAFVKLK